MKKILIPNYQKDKRFNYLNVLVFLFGVFIQQSISTKLGNLSIVDFVLFLLLIYLFLNKKLKFNKRYLIVFIFFMTYLLIISVYYTPIMFDVIIDNRGLTIEVVKLVTLILYFYVGKILEKENKIKYFIKIYSYFALFIAIAGIILSFLNFSIIYEVFFKYGGRLTGLMNDPNYFAILQVGSLPYFLKNEEIKNRERFFATTSISLSIILSASKTGIIVLGIYLIKNYVERVLISKQVKRLKDYWIKYLSSIFMLVLIFFVTSNITIISNYLNHYFPTTQRVTSLFNDFTGSITTDGSSRTQVWSAGLGIIKETPFVGIGLSNYINISKSLFGVRLIAHNTYIQLAVEWGVPVALLFFFMIFINIIKSTFKYASSFKLSVQKDILIVFLLGSFSISLNNARLFWIILGAFMYTMNAQKQSNNIIR